MTNGSTEVVDAREERRRHVMTPAEVAEEYRVDPKTVSRWAGEGRFDNVDVPGWKGNVSFRTPGGHRRFFRQGIEAMLGITEDAA